MTYWSLSGAGTLADTLIIGSRGEDGGSGQLGLGGGAAIRVTVLQKDWWFTFLASVKSSGLDFAGEREDLTTGCAIFRALAVIVGAAGTVTDRHASLAAIAGLDLLGLAARGALVYRVLLQTTITKELARADLIVALAIAGTGSTGSTFGRRLLDAHCTGLTLGQGFGLGALTTAADEMVSGLAAQEAGRSWPQTGSSPVPGQVQSPLVQAFDPAWTTQVWSHFLLGLGVEPLPLHS